MTTESNLQARKDAAIVAARALAAQEMALQSIPWVNRLIDRVAEAAVEASDRVGGVVSRAELLEGLLAEAETEMSRATQDTVRDYAATTLFLRERLVEKG